MLPGLGRLVPGPCAAPHLQQCRYVPYRGVNILLLWGEATARGYAENMWMTYVQTKELGAHVRKGEQDALVVYADSFTRTEINEDGKDEEREIPFMKGYTVF